MYCLQMRALLVLGDDGEAAAMAEELPSGHSHDPQVCMC